MSIAVGPVAAPLSDSRAERIADLWVHAIGLVAAPLAVLWLLVERLPRAAAPQAEAVAAIYCGALLAMLSASASYNLAPPGPAKALLRRLDHAVIFVMIAASYAPFALLALASNVGVPLCAFVSALAAIGAGLKLAAIGRGERGFLLLYLGLGWSLLAVLPSFLAALSSGVLMLLLAGGMVYTAGALIHAHGEWRFHNALWHALVLLAAALHFAAVAALLAPSAG